MPGDTHEDAANQKMVDRLRFLRAEDAGRIMGETVSGEAVGGPATTLVGKPEEEFNSEGRPVLPNETPIGGGGTAEEKGLVAGAHGVDSDICPPPRDHIGDRRERNSLDEAPDLDVLDKCGRG